MARFLLLLILLLSPIRNSYAQYSNYCYCTTPWTANQTFGQSCRANADCWACAPGAYPQSWQQAFCGNYQAPQVVTCTYSAQTETRSCPVNYSGTQTWKKETNCPSGSYGQPVQTDWFKIQDTCVQNPPTCQISSQQQTLQCQTGYTGSITQTRSSTCPDPYGQPVWQPWVTTSDTCKKSINNPTNPVSPVSPLNPASSISAPTIQSSPVTAPTPNSVPNSETTPTTQETTTETGSAPTQENSATQTPAPTSASETKTDSQTTSTTPASPTPKGKTQSVVGLVLSLELFVKPGLQQPNVFPEVQIVQGLPNDVIFSGQLLVDVYGYSMPDQSGLFNKMARDAVELEQ